MIVVNFKTYPEATGYKAIELARSCKRVADQSGVRIVAVPQLANLGECVETGAECWVQHVDGVNPGRNTGWVTVESVEEAGAKGTLLNHSEHKIELERFDWASLGKYPSFGVCLCVEKVSEAQLVLQKYRPDWLAYEPAELIGSREKSVASEKPEIIAQMVEVAKDVSVLIGAGVHSSEDVRVGLKLGAKGVLLATDVVLAADPEQELTKLAEAFLERWENETGKSN